VLLATGACDVIAGIGDLPYPHDATVDGPTAPEEASRAEDVITSGADATDGDAGPTSEEAATAADGPETAADAADAVSNPYRPPFDAATLFVQANATFAYGAGNGSPIQVTVMLNAPVQAHHSLIVAARFSVGMPPALTDTLHNTFTKIVGPFGNQTDPWCAIWYVQDAGQGGTESVTATLDATTMYDSISLYVHEYSGLGSVDDTATKAGSGMAIDSGPLMTSAYDDLVFAFAASGSVSPGDGFAPRSRVYSQVTEDTIAATPGSHPALAILGGTTGNWVMVAASFKTQ
jgi:hypothetical protein